MTTIIRHYRLKKCTDEHLPSDQEKKFVNELGDGRVNIKTLNDESDNNKNNDLDGVGINTNALISLVFMKLTATTSTSHDCPNGNIDHTVNKEALEQLSSFRSRDCVNLLDEGNCTTDVSKAIDIDTEIPSISDTNKTRIQQTVVTENKTNNNTVRVTK